MKPQDTQLPAPTPPVKIVAPARGAAVKVPICKKCEQPLVPNCRCNRVKL